MKPSYEQLEQERNELAALLKRLRSAITEIMDDSCGVAGYRFNNEITWWGEFWELENVLSETKPAALAALK